MRTAILMLMLGTMAVLVAACVSSEEGLPPFTPFHLIDQADHD